MDRPTEWQVKRILITVLAYPSPSKKYTECVCVAGITMRSHEWVRLYPVPFRELPPNQRFHKYDVLEVRVRRHTFDTRPESYRPDCQGFKRIGRLDTREGWRARSRIVLAASSQSMCEILRQQKATGKSLGVFKPASVEDFVVEDAPAEWPKRRLQILAQGSLFNPGAKKLEKIPLRFYYKYKCAQPDCRGHRQTLIDWEAGALYRNLRDRGHDLPAIKKKIRQKFLDELCSERKNTHFFVGNQHLHPRSFLVLGVYWPPRGSE